MQVQAQLLILDDNTNFRSTIADILVEKGYFVHQASTGSAAIALINQHPLDVALIDLKLTDMAGLDVLRKIHQKSPETKSILLTGHASQQAAIQALNEGAYYFFQKPVNIDQLLSIVRNAVEARRSAKQLTLSEEKNRSITEALPDCLVELDRKGIIRHVQQPASKARFLPKLRKGEPLTDYLPDQLGKQLIKAVSCTLDQAALQQMEIHLERGGRAGDFEIRMVPKGEQDVLALIRDISEQKAFQREAESRRIFLESVFEAAPDAIITLDEQHRVVEWNSVAEQMFGYTENEAIGKNLDDLIAPPESGHNIEAQDLTRQVLSGKVVSPTETIRHRKDGSPIHVLVAGAPFLLDGELAGVVSTYTDISERVRAERALQLSEERYRSFMDNFEGIVYRSGIGFDFTFVHGAVQKITGYSEDELLSGEISWLELIYPDDRSEILDSKEIAEAEDFTLEREYRIRKKEGELVWVSEVLQSIHDQEGKQIHLQGMIRDISDQKSLQNILDWQLRVNRDVAELSHKIIESSPIEEISGMVLKKAQQLTGSMFGFVGYVNPQSGEILSLAVSDEVWEYYPQESREQILLSHRGLWKRVLESQEPTLYNVAEQQGGPLAGYEGQLPIRNVLTAPVLIDGGAAGFITMLNPREEYISRDLQLVMYLADIYSLALGRKETEQQLRYLATHDDLTNLPNRVYFNNTISQALAQVGTDVHLAVLLLDLNDFKQVNDTYGHKSGDQVLQQAAQRLRSSLRKSDTIARWGGDEFVIVVESDPEYRGPEVVVEKILGAFTDPIDLDHNQIPMTVSIGVSLYPQDGRDVESLIRHADEAMYHAKQNGYTHCFYSCIVDQKEPSNHPPFSKPDQGQRQQS